MFELLLDSNEQPDVRLRYNVAPTQLVSAIRSDGQSRSLDLLRWGLIPAWAKDKSIGSRMINARSETVAEKPSFRSAFKSRRCLIVADGFYEWVAGAEGKQPVHICMQNQQPFAFAGLWETWTDKSFSEADDSEKNPQTIQSCTILTTSSNSLLENVHDRMPVILKRDDHQMWLDPQFEDRESLQELLRPFPSEPMQLFPVSKLANSPRNDIPECAEPIELQQKLF